MVFLILVGIECSKFERSVIEFIFVVCIIILSVFGIVFFGSFCSLVMIGVVMVMLYVFFYFLIMYDVIISIV